MGANGYKNWWWSGGLSQTQQACATKFADIAQWRTQINVEESIFTMKNLKIRYITDQERFGKSVSRDIYSH